MRIRKVFNKFIAVTIVITMLPFSARITKASDFKGMDNTIESSDGSVRKLPVKEKGGYVKLIEDYDVSGLDTDGEGLLDWQEKEYGTSNELQDSDADQLSDYQEIVLQTDPTVKDSDGDKTLDTDEDYDADGISNIAELRNGADPTKVDTDSDGLNDGDEILHGTMPTNSDTDKDGLSDGDEIALGLNPLKSYSNDYVLDRKRIFNQELSQDQIAGSLIESNLVIPSLSGNVTGRLDSNVSITDTEILSDYISIIGKPVKITSAYAYPVELTLSFNYAKLLEIYDQEYVSNLMVCEYKDNEILPIDTVVFEKSKTISANITKGGIYIIINVKDFLRNVGIDPLISIPLTQLGQQAQSASYSVSASGTAITAVETEPEGNWVLLSDYQYVELDGAVSEMSMTDTDQDGVLDIVELGTCTAKDLSAFTTYLLEENGVPAEKYTGKTQIYVYNYISNPTLKDTDFDGIDDDVDRAPLDGKQEGILENTSSGISSNVNYTMDFRTFFGSNSNYSAVLSLASSVYAAVMYGGVTFFENSTAQTYDIVDLLSFQGFLDVKDYSLSSNYSDSHLSEVAVGHRKVTYNGSTKEVMAVIIRGTNGTIQEWSSNFNIGSENSYSTTTDWIVKSNHMGFDIASTRILKYIASYEASYVDSSVGKVVWITGHSRGAALANIVGARLEDKGYDTFTYTFAAPNTTTSSNAKDYSSIFNIVNADDFVPCLPMTDWGFTRYGKTATVSIADNYESEWEDLTSINDYDPDTIGMQTTVDALASIAKDRNDCYTYTCDCHGDGSDDTITIRNYGMSMSSRENAIAKIPTNALPFCIITRYSGGLFSGWDFECCQTPSYFMQVLAAQMAGTINAYRFSVELDIAVRYEYAKTRIISSAIGGLEHPHYQESYYVLANHIQNENFQ